MCYRLCVCASGSLITDIFSWRTAISVSCLHFGQYSGKFSSIVSSRSFIRVLFPHTGHNAHFVFLLKGSASINILRSGCYKSNPIFACRNTICYCLPFVILVYLIFFKSTGQAICSSYVTTVHKLKM